MTWQRKRLREKTGRRLVLRPAESLDAVRSQPGAGCKPMFFGPNFSPSPSRAAPPDPARSLPSRAKYPPNPAPSLSISRQNRFLSSRIHLLRAQLKDKSSKSSEKFPFLNPNHQGSAGAISKWAANPRGRLHRHPWRSRRRCLLPSRSMHKAPGFQLHLCSHHGWRVPRLKAV
jgi:hypothetical protein